MAACVCLGHPRPHKKSEKLTAGGRSRTRTTSTAGREAAAGGGAAAILAASPPSFAGTRSGVGRRGGCAVVDDVGGASTVTTLADEDGDGPSPPAAAAAAGVGLACECEPPSRSGRAGAGGRLCFLFEKNPTHWGRGAAGGEWEERAVLEGRWTHRRRVTRMHPHG